MKQLFTQIHLQTPPVDPSQDWFWVGREEDRLPIKAAMLSEQFSIIIRHNCLISHSGLYCIALVVHTGLLTQIEIRIKLIQVGVDTTFNLDSNPG